ncbi:uncharacterized protein METZ01_LOCUS420043, partial [marine metagenome]
MYEACSGMPQTMVVKLVMDGKVSKFNLGNFPHPDLTLRILQKIDSISNTGEPETY